MNKITKLLSVFVIAGAIGTGVAGAVGCGGGNSGNGGGGAHTHEYEYTLNTNDTTKHTVHCKNPGHEGEDTTEGHTWGTDNKCTKCKTDKPDLGVTGVTVTTQPQTIYVGGTVELEATVATSKDGVDTSVTWEIVTGKTYATIEGNVLTATKRGTVNVQAVSVADSTKKSSAIAITIEERNIYADLVADKANNIIGENFEDTTGLTDNKLPTYPGHATATEGVYAWGDWKDMTKTGSITVSNGKATYATDKENISIVADLGDKVKDIVEGYVEWSADALGGKWAILALKGTSDAVSTTGDVFSIYTPDGSKGALGYRVGENVTPVDDVVLTAGTTYEIHFKLDMVSGLITVDIKTQGGDSVNLCTNVQTGIKSLRAVAFVSSSSGDRHPTIDNLAINSKAVTLEQVKTSLKARLDSYVATATVDTADEDGDKLTLAGENVTTAADAIKEAIDNATTIEDAKAAYATTTVDAAILANAKASAKAFIDDMRTDTTVETFTGDAATDLANAKQAAKGDIDSATDLAEVKTAFLNGKNDVNDVENDEARTQADVNISFTSASTEVGTLSKKDGETLSLAEVRANTTVAANKIVTGIKVDGAAVVLPYTLEAVNNATTNITIEVVLSDYANLTATADCGAPTTATGEDITGLGTDGFFTLTGCAKATSGSDATKYQQGKLQTATASVTGGKYTHQIGLTSGKVGKYANDAIGNSILFTVDKECTVTVVCANAATKTNKLSVLTSAGSAATVSNIKKNGVAATEFETAPEDTTVTYEFTLAAGTYHVGGSGGGLLVFEISVIH